MKSTLMIHEFKEDYLDLPLEQYVLTFDDGLYSQFLYLEELIKLNTELIFSIPTGLIQEESLDQDPNFISCVDALRRARTKDFSNYMKWSQVQKIFNSKNCIISAHSHSHIDLRTIEGLYNKIEHINTDTIWMLTRFKWYLNYVPNIFCFPFNYDYSFYMNILKGNFGFTKFLGNDRIPIESLL